MPQDHRDKQPSPAVESERDDTNGTATFPVVGVGASAGGVEALTQLLRALPTDTGMAFVLIPHLAPSHPSALAEILARVSRMPVNEVRDEPEVEPNRVYVIPPGRDMVIAGGRLKLLPRDERGAHRPIDRFFRALAEERRHQAIGVVLSGTATDGTLGLEAIKGEGGIAFAQDATALHEDMPHSAILSGSVDFVLSPEAIAGEIVRISQHPYAVPVLDLPAPDDEASLHEIVKLLHHSRGVDFSHYKRNTLFRRITRRMVLQKLNRLRDYAHLLQQAPAEVDALYQDVLISVTSFFRDREAFEALKSDVFPQLVQARSPHDPVRVWTLGCSTGQEAYSLAMAYEEFRASSGSPVTLQLFATDLNGSSIEVARAGIYPRDIAQDVSPERLRKFFTEVEGGYRISKSIRDLCVFSRHNVLADPPFSRLDLVTCRNLLIYMEPVLQQRIVPMLHYVLKPNGLLWLGTSETIGSHRNLFEVRDLKHKFFEKKPGPAPMLGSFPLQHGELPRVAYPPHVARMAGGGDLLREADRMLVTKFAPPSVLVSADLDILQYRGDTGPYMAPAAGRASLHLLKMLREGLLVGVRSAVVRARDGKVPVREEGMRVSSDGGFREVAVEVIPLRVGLPDERGFLILFDETGTGARGDGATAAPAGSLLEDEDATRLQQELLATREYMQSLVEQQEAANEELQSANEEVQSTNEELQSINEELETSKEEIQSSNEELATVNDELNMRNTELTRSNNDLQNLIASVQLPIVMLGPDLRVRRFTPSAEKLLHLSASDVGRAVRDVDLGLQGLSELDTLAHEVLDTVHALERDVRDREGRWHLLRLRPYRTADNRIDGVVLVLVDVDALKQSHAELRAHAEELARFNSIAVGRELRMIELKKEINDLCMNMGLAARYPLEFEGEDQEGPVSR